MSTNEPDGQINLPEPPKLTREQRRQMENVNQKAKDVHQALCEKFGDFFILCDNPDGPEVEEKLRQINAQWVVFCKKMNLRPDVFEAVKKYCTHLIDEYKREKKTEEPKSTEA